ncbi:MAG: alpha/beta fold hydrolase [Terracidiphilus sp.]
MTQVRRNRWKWGWRIAVAALVLVALGAFGFWERPVSYFDGFMHLRMWLEGAHSRWTTVDGYRVHYFVEGPARGRPVVLVHGLGARAEDWRNLAPYLAKAGDRVYMPDLIGYGRSAKPQNFSYSVRAEAGIVTGFMNALGLKQVDLGGWSMGGWVAQLVAIDDPGRIERMMLFDSAGLADRPSWNTNLFMPTTPEQLNELNALLRPHPKPIPGFVSRAVLRLSRTDAWIIRRAMDTMLAGRDVTNSMLPKLRMPVLIVWGGDDHLIPLEEGEQMHALIPQSRFEVAAGCGHLAPLDCAGLIGPQAAAFLKQ